SASHSWLTDPRSDSQRPCDHAMRVTRAPTIAMPITIHPAFMDRPRSLSSPRVEHTGFATASMCERTQSYFAVLSILAVFHLIFIPLSGSCDPTQRVIVCTLASLVPTRPSSRETAP